MYELIVSDGMFKNACIALDEVDIYHETTDDYTILVEPEDLEDACAAIDEAGLCAEIIDPEDNDG